MMSRSERVRDLESRRDDLQRMTNKRTGRVKSTLEAKKREIIGADKPVENKPHGGMRRASISERMLGTLGIGPEAGGAPGESPKPNALRRLSVSLTGAVDSALGKTESDMTVRDRQFLADQAAAQAAAEEEARTAEEERKLAEQGRQLVVRKQLTELYRKHSPSGLAGLEDSIAELGADKVLEGARQEFREQIKEDQIEQIFDFLGVVGTDVQAEDVAQSFENVGYEVDTWSTELREMPREDLKTFLQAVQESKDQPPSKGLPGLGAGSGADPPQKRSTIERTVSESTEESSEEEEPSFDAADDIAAEAYAEDELREMQVRGRAFARTRFQLSINFSAVHRSCASWRVSLKSQRWRRRRKRRRRKRLLVARTLRNRRRLA